MDETTQKFNAKPYSIEVFLDDEALKKARTAAPGWDIYYLMTIYDQAIRKGIREPPDSPTKAFPAWCALYTKGKPPKGDKGYKL
ncbi:MAG: hypothetical protein KJ017_09940 [Alphaproteobacteria bacterium]|nr:hypothetical protein [Alphaproteobacteria bacterium]